MKRYLLISILLVVVLVFAGCTATTTISSTPEASPTTSTISTPYGGSPGLSSTTQSSDLPSDGAVSDLQNLLESIYTQVSPSVVSIQVIENAPATTNPFAPATPSGALGSGFVWDNNGDIVTNNHVIAGASSITVTFIDGTTVKASVVGTDLDSDLAVIKVNPSGLQLRPVSMADSAQLKVGQMALAIGNPFGLQNTLTVGVVSGLGRLLPATQNTTGPAYSIPDIIQTDAAINPGNSGGVLLDTSGKVIGITQSIETSSGTSSGVGFAIPSQIIQQVVPALISTGHYDHPYVGVSVISLDPDLATAMNLPANQHGALVETVVAGGPAANAGLQASQKPVTINGQQINVGGDVIIAYNGQPVKSSDDLVTMVALMGKVGETVTFTILRNGQQMDVKVTLGLRPVTSTTTS